MQKEKPAKRVHLYLSDTVDRVWRELRSVRVIGLITMARRRGTVAFCRSAVCVTFLELRQEMESIPVINLVVLSLK